MKETPQFAALATLAGSLIGVGLGQGLARAGYGTEALAIAVVLLILALARSTWVGISLREPLRRLADVADRVAAGDLGVRVPRIGSRETVALASALRRMVRKLRHTTVSRDDLDRVLRSMNGALFVVSTDARVRAANATAADMLGCTAESLIGRSFFDFVEDTGPLLDSAADEPHGRQTELEMIDHGGGRIPVLLSVSRVDGRQDFVCVAQEIRAQRNVEAQLQRINVQLWLLNQVTTIALRTRDLEPALSQIAEALRASGGYSAVGFALRDPETDGLRMHAFAGFSQASDTAEQIGTPGASLLWQVIAQREPIILHMEGSRLELGDPLFGTVSAGILGVFPMRVEGRIIGVAVLGEERLIQTAEEFGRSGMDFAQHVAALVDQKLANEALRHSNQALELARLAAEDASRAKSEFLANMSHEIRTPMTAILGYADLVREEDRDRRETAEFVETIRRNGEHLMSIVNDILDLSKIEAGQVGLELVACSPVELARDVVEMMQRRAEDRGISLEIDFDWPLPARIESDPTRLRQILANLVGNAVKFTDKGGVRVVVRRHPGRSTAIVFEVVDTGIGMTARELGRLFKPFSQADTSHTRRFGGTGLGLAISQRLASLLGGSISVQSRKGHGSRFSVEIEGGDVAREAEVSGIDELVQRFRAVPRRDGMPAKLDCRVLLAEDGPDNQRLVSFLLEKAGAHVEVVADGRAAVRAALAAVEAGAAFDVVLMDMQMPVLDGYGATRQLRAAGYAGPIIALTAHAMRGDEERCREAGCDEFLSKPIDRRALITAIAALTGPVADPDR